MCGLAGIMSGSGGAPDGLRAVVKEMTQRLSHRGPDASGDWVDAGIALGHRRLSILDLSPAGAQPMVSACGRYVLVFNGEIYNHLDLRRDLAALGAAPPWRGHSDTETLLAGVVHWGLDETLTRAAGMFAIALWDRQERRLALARDRIGEKPLYWGMLDGAVVFGSELKALRAYPGFPQQICREALALYLQFTYVPAPHSIHPGIYKVEPGTIIEIDRAPPVASPKAPLRPGDRHGSLSIRRYWSLNELIEEGSRNRFNTDEEALAALETGLVSAVGRQMLSDVPIGAFLSGGIDSSLIVALMQAQSPRPVRTFTVGFENPTYNEAPYAAAVARHLKTDHTEVVVTETEAQQVIPRLPELYDEPFADSSQIPTVIVCYTARAHVTVALSGDGGDELFGGYNRYILGPDLWKKISLLPIPMRKLLARGALSVSESGWDGVGAIYNSLRPSGSGVAELGSKIHRVANRLDRVSSIDDLHKELVRTAGHFGVVPDGEMRFPILSVLDDQLPKALDLDAAGRMMAQDMRSYLPDDILCKVDRAAMGVSLETRVPFLDPAVLELSARLPSEMKIRDGRGKWALRQILYRHVPSGLIDRPKTGFSIPVGDWLRGSLREWAEDLLSLENLSAEGLLDPAPIRQAWAEHLSGRRDWTHQLWTILMLQAWRKQWRPSQIAPHVVPEHI